MTGIISVFVLLLVFDSVQVHDTATLLVRGVEVLDATLTFSTTAADPFVAAIAFVVKQVTTCPIAKQFHPVVVELTNVSPVGRVSVTFTAPLEAPAPELDTVTVIWSLASFTVKLDGE
jgi:hypothetical protein